MLALTAIGTDVWFVAAITDADTASRARRGPLPVSLEMEGRGVLPRPDERGVVLPFVLPTAYRGRRGPGFTLTAVALLRDGDRPAARGSALWLAS